MAVGGGGEAAGADEGVAIAGEVEDDRTVWDRADVTARWDRRDRDKRCFIAMTDSLRLSLSLQGLSGEETGLVEIWEERFEIFKSDGVPDQEQYDIVLGL